MSHGSGSSTVGYKYYVGVHMVLCHGPIDKLTKIRVDDKEVWSGSSTGGVITVAADEIFGGESREGGISGVLDFLTGVKTQVQNTYLVSKLGSLVPAFRGVASVVLNHMYMSMNPYLKVWSFMATRIHVQQDGDAQWQDSYAQIDVIGYDSTGTPVTIAAMNPAHIIRECLTNKLWGMGYSTADIDDTAFLACAVALKTEGMGICLVWDTQSSIEDFVKIIIQHINAVIYVNRKTGKFVLKLVRDDYDESTLMHFNESNAEAVEDFKRAAFGELPTSITVNYWNVVDNVATSLTIQDIALEQEQNSGPINTTVTYEGFVDGVTASKAGQRDLRALSTPLINCTLSLKKSARGLNVGDVFKLSWADYQISDVVMRVTGIGYGTGKSRRVKVTCVQDVFGYPEDAFVTDPGTGWTDPSAPPGPAHYQMAFELPYYEMARTNGQSSVDASITANPYIGHVGAAMSPPATTVAISGLMWTDNGSGYTQVDTAVLCGGAALSANVGYMDTTIHITGGINLDMITAGDWFQIDDELLIYVSRAGTVVTVKRGALDTMPAPHSTGAAVLLWDHQNSLDGTEYVASDIVDVKMRTVSGSGVLDLSSATPMTVDVVGRMAKPYPPKKVKLNGAYYPMTTTFTTDVVVTWVDRNRTIETGGTLLSFTDAGVTLESSVLYEIRIYDSSNVLQFTYTGLTGHTYTVLLADILPFAPFVWLEMDSYRGSIYSFQKFRCKVSLGAPEETEAGTTMETEGGSTLELEA